jgi:hypothetical protein
MQEWAGFETQKPVDLIERILSLASNPGDLIMDSFIGSGSAAIAAERLGRRWIGCDLSKWAIQVTRKRLLQIEDCRPFEKEGSGIPSCISDLCATPLQCSHKSTPIGTVIDLD